jgi:hypothetical protein
VVDFVTDYDSSLHGSLLTGDLNAIKPFDTAFPSTYNLPNAYLALGGEEDMEKGFTWGYQPQRSCEISIVAVGWTRYFAAERWRCRVWNRSVWA